MNNDIHLNIQKQGWVNVLIEHQPTIRDIASNKYLKEMFEIPKTSITTRHLQTPDKSQGVTQQPGGDWLRCRGILSESGVPIHHPNIESTKWCPCHV